MVSEPVPNPPPESGSQVGKVSPQGRKLEVVVASLEPRAAEISAADRAAEMYGQLDILLRRARLRMRRIMNDYPVHVVATAASAAFLAGLLLRIGRNSRNA